ncbi:hypothetical protein HaLaN_05431, partial [Haematococcus lacustris]
MDRDLMRPQAWPLRLDGVAEPRRSRRKGNASVPSPPHRVQPVPVAVGSKRMRGRDRAAQPDLSPAQVDAVVAQ